MTLAQNMPEREGQGRATSRRKDEEQKKGQAEEDQEEEGRKGRGGGERGRGGGEEGAAAAAGGGGGGEEQGEEKKSEQRQPRSMGYAFMPKALRGIVSNDWLKAAVYPRDSPTCKRKRGGGSFCFPLVLPFLSFCGFDSRVFCHPSRCQRAAGPDSRGAACEGTRCSAAALPEVRRGTGSHLRWGRALEALKGSKSTRDSA